MKMLKITIIAVISLVILGVIAMAVDYYFYSWSSAVRPFGCEYKSIGVDLRNNKLKQFYNLNQIRDVISLNQNYEIITPYLKEFDNENTLKISRKFNGIKYNIEFWEHTRIDDYFIKIDFTNFNSEVSNALLPIGEKPTTPNYYIKNNIHQMIDEMPLNDAQKDELKSKVWISCSPTAKIGF